uniref:Uncharacterized protein n=1 Tax=Solanum lycopersicum TaxID=4081 RepID=A0A3Q7I6L8_SOLLC
MISSNNEAYEVQHGKCYQWQSKYPYSLEIKFALLVFLELFLVNCLVRQIQFLSLCSDYLVIYSFQSS